MQFLTVFIIVLAILPNVVAVKCWVGEDWNGKEVIKKQEKDCGGKSSYCANSTISSEGNTEEYYLCGNAGICDKEGCEKLEYDDYKIELCCCNGDLCNSAATPTVLLSLEGVAAMLGWNTTLLLD